MSDPSKISRDVKGLVADFREELRLRDPWDREIDIQFKRIQRRYKELLFDFPFAKQSHSVDQALWQDTSYALINRYRTRIDPVRNSSATDKRIVENRKILQRFLAFLGTEGALWSGIVLRLVRMHGLHEASAALAALGMDVVEFENRESLNRRGTHLEAEGVAAGEDSAPPNFPPPTAEVRSNKMLAVFRSLVFLGDLARYREQYGAHPDKPNNENGRRPRGGRRGKDKKVNVTPERGYSKAEAFYLQAKLLLPDYGNPFNQLAIVHSYRHDPFGAALNYYRAICVRHPFPTAKDNLILTLVKCLEEDKKMARVRKARETHDAGLDEAPASDGPGDLETKFKQDVVLLHALWAGKNRPAKLARQGHNVLASFASLTLRRILPTATLVQVLVLALGALWKVRMFRDAENKHSRTTKAKGKAKADEEASLETCIMAHILALATILLEIGTQEIGEGTCGAEGTLDESEDAVLSERLAQRITGTFRRTLPALRIANKWIKTNVEYIERHRSALSALPNSSEPSSSSTLEPIGPARSDYVAFWQAWARFSTRLLTTFPLEVLPDMTVTLEEDIDMTGFSPLRRGLSGPAQGADAASVHPNEEQLMRIRDLIVDAKFIVRLPGCPVSLVEERYIMSDAQDNNQVESLVQVYKERGAEYTSGSETDEAAEHPEDDRATVSTRTEDDPVRLAMNAVLSDDEETEDEEEILYPQKGKEKQVTVFPLNDAYRQPATPAGPVWPLPIPSFLSDSPTMLHPKPAPQPQASSIKPSGTTAEDLVNRFMNSNTLLPASSVPGRQGTGADFTTRTPALRQHVTFSSFDPGLDNAFASMNPFPAKSLSFESPNTRFPGQGSAFPQTPTFMHDSNSTFPTHQFPDPQSEVSSQQSVGSRFAPSSPPIVSSNRKVSDSAVPYFPSHTRVTSLSGATSIWTPAPQEAPHLGMQRSGSVRANSMSAGVGASAHNRLPGLNTVWSPQENRTSGPRSPLGFGNLERSKTLAAPTGVPRW